MDRLNLNINYIVQDVLPLLNRPLTLESVTLTVAEEFDDMDYITKLILAIADKYNLKEGN